LCLSLSAQTDTNVYLIPIQKSDHIKRNFNTDEILNAKPYRIIHFGDSHIQGDRITNEIRSHLQQLYGNAGSGVIFPYSLTGSFGPLGTKSSIKGGYSYSSQLKNASNRPIGIMGYELSLTKGAEFTVSFSDKFKGKITNEMVVWINSNSDTLDLTFNQGKYRVDCLRLQRGIRKYHITSDKQIDTLIFQTNDECSLWGFEFVSKEGLIYQQNGVVGAQFTHLIKHENEVLLQLKELKPNLLIFSYGTNESYSNLDTVKYKNTVENFLRRLMTELPEASILITNAPDTRSAGRIPSNELAINRVLKRISEELELSFYDANEAMGGWGSLHRWNKRGYFNKDLLHFSFSGASLFGKLISYALLNVLQDSTAFVQQLEIDIKENLPAKETEVNINAETSTNEEIVTPKKKQKYYIVKSGDSLSKIAQKTGSSVNVLVRKNNLKSADKIKPGQKLFY
jgi:lysophospholipase L1-like esterase